MCHFLRWTRFLLLALVLVEALYVVAMNVFLSTPLFGLVVNGAPDVVWIHYARGWSLFPTRVTAKDLVIRASDSNVEWILTLDEVTFDCSLLELARMRFHVTRARGSGIAFRMRRRVESPLATDEYVRGLPPVQGFPVVGIRPSEPPSPMTWSDEKWHLWTVALEDVVAEDVHQVWFDHLRFEGDARVAGGFYLKPIRATEVRPLEVTVRGGALSVAEKLLLEPLSLEGELAVRRFDPRMTAVDAVLRRVQLDVHGKTRVPELAKSPVAEIEAVSLRGEVEIPLFVVRVESGLLRDGTRIDLRAADLGLAVGDHSASGQVSLAASVADDALTGWAALRDWRSDMGMSVPRAHLTADSIVLDLGAPIAGLHATADIPELEIADVGALGSGSVTDEKANPPLRGSLRGWAHVDAWPSAERIRGTAALRSPELTVFAESWGVRTGEVGAVASGDISLEGPKEAKVELRAPGVRVTHGPTVLLANLRVDASARSSARTSAFGEAFDLSGSRVTVDDASLRGAFVESEGWSGVASFPRAVLSLKPALRLNGEARLEARDANPFFGLLLGESVPRFLAAATAMPHLSAKTTFQASPINLTAPDITASAGDLSARGFYTILPAVSRGAFLLRKGPLSAGVGLQEDGVHVRFFGLDGWLQDEERAAGARIDTNMPGPRF